MRAFVARFATFFVTYADLKMHAQIYEGFSAYNHSEIDERAYEFAVGDHFMINYMNLIIQLSPVVVR